MEEEKAAITGSLGTTGQPQPLSQKDESGPDNEVSSSASERRRQSEDDVETHNHLGPQQSNVSVWASENMSLPQEVLFVATVCMTQFCNREHSPQTGPNFPYFSPK